ncbi:hypothetical protein [Micromonospora sp. NPDC003776]
MPLTARAWGDLWHLDGVDRERRNVLLRARKVDDYSFTDWIYGPAALFPEDEPAMFAPIPLASADCGARWLGGFRARRTGKPGVHVH